VLRDVVKYEKREKSHTMEINHGLQTVRKIAEKGDFMAGKPSLRAKVW
jgi:hypothetical protein